MPPDPPVLTVVSNDIDSLHLKWTDKIQSDIPILGKYDNCKVYIYYL